MGMAQLVVASVLVEGRSKSEVARTYGVSRRWVISLVQRYLSEGEAGLAPRSRRPLRSPNRTPADIEDQIVEILNLIDDHSRLCRASAGRPVFKAGDVDATFRQAAATYGDPASLLSDNGAVFTGRYRRHGRVTLEVTLNTRGVVFTHSRPYHP